MISQTENESSWRWFAAFDDPKAYRRLLPALREIPEFKEGQLVQCPDQQWRIAIEVDRSVVNELESVLLHQQKVSFKKMIKRTSRANFEFVPTSRHVESRLLDCLHAILAALLRRKKPASRTSS